MSDNNEKTIPAPTPASVPAAVQIRNDVKASILDRSAGGGEVRANIVTRLADAVITERTTMLSSALTKREDLVKQLAKVDREDNIQYARNADGSFDKKNTSASTYSPARMKEIEKFQEDIKKIDAAIEEAFDADAPNFDKLSKL